MKITTFSQLRNNAKKYFDAVERGERIEVYRHGKPIAIISPVESAMSERSERWKAHSPLRIKGVSLSRIILSERKEK
ncbi:MAG: type II toxin-antitoxin system Phd/YefM family antitoxin [Deltaproteobacteria bacterium]|nr:type II toxin-antitoxin system Phd/YefM family antitoxin [Deltaproteobacteria bacterium]MBI3295005.1 type II toxin-antitoxin system Phd/YefM family antitoxin [Deltaproteobacteria bacterium]